MTTGIVQPQAQADAADLPRRFEQAMNDALRAAMHRKLRARCSSMGMAWDAHYLAEKYYTEGADLYWSMLKQGGAA